MRREHYLCTPDAVLHVVWRYGKQHVQQNALLAGVAAVAVDVDQIATNARVHLRQANRPEAVLIERDVVLRHHALDHVPAHH